MRDDIEAKFFQFARSRAKGDDVETAVRSGHFSATPTATKPDLFGSLDILHAAHIVSRLHDFTDSSGRQAWIDHILSYQGSDGWFRSNDSQSHGVEHVTAYALGGLQILTDGDGEQLADKLKPFTGLQREIAADPDQSKPPFDLSLLQRVHFWRGSHRAGGLAAIVGAIDELGLSSRQFLGIDDAKSWLAGWWAYFVTRTDAETGYWALASRPIRAGFNALYKFRHRPDLADMGGAVHLYWVSERINAPMPHPAALISTTIGLMRYNGLYEDEPYCIDLDANFLIARAVGHLGADEGPAVAAHRALAINRDAVLDWFASRRPERWNANSHKVPGAFAAVAEADRLLSTSTDRRWRDVFETTWWL
jgi:hypothetical protein